MRLGGMEVLPGNRVHYVDVMAIHAIFTHDLEIIGVSDIANEGAILFPFLFVLRQSFFVLVFAFVLTLRDELIELLFLFPLLLSGQRLVVFSNATGARLIIQDSYVVGVGLVLLDRTFLVQHFEIFAPFTGIVPGEPKVTLIHIQSPPDNLFCIIGGWKRLRNLRSGRRGFLSLQGCGAHQQKKSD